VKSNNSTTIMTIVPSSWFAIFFAKLVEASFFSSSCVYFLLDKSFHHLLHNSGTTLGSTSLRWSPCHIDDYKVYIIYGYVCEESICPIFSVSTFLVLGLKSKKIIHTQRSWRKTLQLLPKKPQPFVKWCIEISILLNISW
jgi:hypothetical protein